MTEREQCVEIYRAAFGDSGEFDNNLFDLYFDCCEYLKIDGEVAAMLFALECTLCLDGKTYPCRYIYAAATADKFRSRGFMTRLLAEQSGILMLKPATDALIKFYAERGFRPFSAVHSSTGNRRVEVDDRFSALAMGGNNDGTSFTAMVRSNVPLNLEGLAFAYTME